MDDRGRVLGINTRIEVTERQQTFVHPQLNFALQSTLASRIVTELLSNKGRLVRAYLGIEIRQNLRGRGAAPEEPRAEIAGVIPGGPASAALEGKAGFAIERINHSPVHALEDALAALEKVRPGETVSLELRNPEGDAETVSIKAGFLDERNLGAIAAFVLKNEISLQADAREGGIVLQRASATPDMRSAKAALRLVQLRKETDGDRPPVTQPSPELTLVAIGLVGEDDALLYRVADMSAAGAAMKLVAMSGRIDLLCLTKGSKDPITAKFRFSAEPGIAGRTLLY